MRCLGTPRKPPLLLSRESRSGVVTSGSLPPAAAATARDTRSIYQSWKASRGASAWHAKQKCGLLPQPGGFEGFLASGEGLAAKGLAAAHGPKVSNAVFRYGIA